MTDDALRERIRAAIEQANEELVRRTIQEGGEWRDLRAADALIDLILSERRAAVAEELAAVRDIVREYLFEQHDYCEYGDCDRYATQGVEGEVAQRLTCDEHAGTGYGEIAEAPLVRWLEKEDA